MSRLVNCRRDRGTPILENRGQTVERATFVTEIEQIGFIRPRIGMAGIGHCGADGSTQLTGLNTNLSQFNPTSSSL